MNREKESFLLDLLEETKRMIIALNVVKEQRLQDYQERLTPDRQPYAGRAGNILCEGISARLLTALMVVIGYRIPNDLYSLNDYSQLCDWLGATEEDGEQRWEDS
jgi:hypothetical protein